MNKSRVLLIVFLLGIRLFPYAQQGASSADIYWQMQKLKVLGSVLYIGAHPDDENTQLLAYLSKGKMYRTGYLSLTRGDGGQNLIGDEQGVELGLIRTQEMLAARKIDGAEQYFTRAFDFGFSKRPDEALSKWNEEQILSDVVWVIRKFQPDVIITRWPTTGEGGHGHHTASAILAVKAFEAAADASKFTEQLKYVSVWKAKRLLWNSFEIGTAQKYLPSDFKVDAGAFDPLLGKSYGEIAALSRSMHKTQAMGTAASRGADWEDFKTIGGTKPTKDLLDDVNVGWNRVDESGLIFSSINKLIDSYDFNNPQHSIANLVQIYKDVKRLPKSEWRTQKLKEIQDLIAACGGLYLEAISGSPLAYRNDSIKVTVTAISRLQMGSKWLQLELGGSIEKLDTTLIENSASTVVKTIKVDAEKPITQPYWLINEKQKDSYVISQQELVGEADVQPSYTAKLTFEIAGERFEFEIPVQYKYTDPVRGELYQPLVVTYSKGTLQTADTLVRKEIKYNHIPLVTYFKPIEKEFLLPEIKTAGKRIGYIVGAGDKVPAALLKMGYELVYIGEKELASASELQKFDAIITGVRAYNTQKWLLENNKQLLSYVEQGGNLIVQYNTPDFDSIAMSAIGPVPFVITKNRITNEDAPVRMLQPMHPVFHFPNEITDNDFIGWVQERSTYHAIDNSHSYTKLIGMADPGESEQDGSLLTIQYGKGSFSYVGLTLFRQLPAGVPGAYKLLANLIALNQKKGF
jgi:LmbE family N-acetylglucosaminyl deacetylase